MKYPPKPIVVVSVSVIVYIIAWFIIIAIDIFNFYNIQDRLDSTGIEYPLVWVHIFHEAGPIEIVVWIFLGLSALLLAMVAGKLFGNENRSLGKACMLLAFGLLLMLIEDAGNPSHRISHWTSTLGISFPVSSRLIVFLPITAILFGAVIFHRSVLESSRAAYLFFASGFMLYGIAVIWSLSLYTFVPGATSREEIGLWVHAEIFQNTLMHDDLSSLALGWQMSDFVLEESLEYFGATAFLGGRFLCFEIYYQKNCEF